MPARAAAGRDRRYRRPGAAAARWCARLGTCSKATARRRCCSAETRALDATAQAEIAAAFDRYQVPWQATLDALAQAGRIASAVAPVRLLLLACSNWSTHWVPRRRAVLSVDESADAAVAMLLQPDGKRPGRRLITAPGARQSLP